MASMGEVLVSIIDIIVTRVKKDLLEVVQVSVKVKVEDNLFSSENVNLNEKDHKFCGWTIGELDKLKPSLKVSNEDIPSLQSTEPKEFF